MQGIREAAGNGSGDAGRGGMGLVEGEFPEDTGGMLGRYTIY